MTSDRTNSRTVAEMRRLLLVRHATSLPPAVDGPDDANRPLTDRGQAEAEALATVVVPYAPQRVLSSPYVRAVQTVEPAAQALGLVVERVEVLREWRSGIGPTPHWHSHCRRCWEQPDRKSGDGETHADLEKRALRGVAQAAAATAEGSVTVVASHGAWISRALHGLGCSVTADFWLTMPMPAMYDVAVSPGDTVVQGPGLHLAIRRV